MSDVSLNTFPSNSIDALALLYVQNQDLSGKTPERICEIYWEAYFRIRKHFADARDSASIRYQ